MSLETLRTSPLPSPIRNLGEVGGDRREALNYIHGLYNYTFRFPLVVGFKGASSNFVWKRCVFLALLSPFCRLPGGIP